MSTVLYKLGGSLLTLPNLAARLHKLLGQRLPFPVDYEGAGTPNRLLLVGGGEIADVVRRWDQFHRLGDERAHALAIHSMSLNARLVAAMLSDAQLIADRVQACDAWSHGSVAILDPAPFLDAEERASGDFLPRSWEVTSDSLAAYVALHWPADALVLIKSLARPTECKSGSGAAGKFVDPHFSRRAKHIPNVGWANLRDDDPVVEHWV